VRSSDGLEAECDLTINSLEYIETGGLRMHIPTDLCVREAPWWATIEHNRGDLTRKSEYTVGFYRNSSRH